MIPAGFTISMSLTVSPRAGGHVLSFLQIAGNGGGGAPDPIPGLCPWTKLRDFRLSDNLTRPHHRGAVPQTVGPEPQGTGACPHLTNSWARRTTYVGKKETHQSALPATKVLAKITNCTRRAININNFLYKNKYGTLVAVG